MRTVHSLDRAVFGALFAMVLAPLGTAGGGTSASVAGTAAPTEILSGQNDRMVLFPIPAVATAEQRALRVRPVGSADPAYKMAELSEPLVPTARYLTPRESAIICYAARPVGRTCERLVSDQQPLVQKHVMPDRAAAFVRLAISGLIDVEPTPQRADLWKHDMSARHIAILRADMAVGTPDTGDKSFTGYTLFGAAKPADPLQPLAHVRLRPGERADLELAVPVEWFEADPVLVLLARKGG